METLYRTTISFKILYSILGAGCFGFAIFLLKTPTRTDSQWIYTIPILFSAGGVLVIINQFKRKLIITDTGITYSNIFKTTTIPFDQISGYRIGEKVISIESNVPGASKIRVNDYISLEDDDSIKDWLKTNFKDLDEMDLVSNRETLLNDAALGYTEEGRKRKIGTAKAVAAVYNTIGMIVGFGMIFIGNDYVAAYATIIYPLLGIGVMKWSYGLTKFLSNKKRSKYNFIMLGFFMPTCIMLFRSLGDYNLYHYEHLWLPFIAIGAIVGFLLVSVGINKSIEGLSAQVGFMVVVSAIYGFGVTVQTNCVFDNSAAKVFQTTVIDKYIHTGKATSYYLVLNPWEPGQQSEKVEVRHKMYQKELEGDTVHVYLKKGTLGIPWFYVAQ